MEKIPENPVPFDHGAKRLEEITQRFKKGLFDIPEDNEETVNKILSASRTRKRRSRIEKDTADIDPAKRLPPVTPEIIEETNKRFPDTF